MFNKIIKNQKLFKTLFFICLISIELLATTTLKIEIIESMWDKSNHLIAFFTLYILISLGFRELSVIKKSLYLLLFAIQIEIVQHFIEGRYFSLLDIVADSIGIALGYIAIVSYPLISSTK